MRILLVSILLTFPFWTTAIIKGQTLDRIAEINSAQSVTLPNHHPQWANKANNVGLLPADQALDHLTLVLSRSPEQEQALQQLLSEQQDLASPNYHHWLTPAEMGERFGPSTHDVAVLSDWLQSQGLPVTWVSSSRMFIGFGGTAATIGRAFQTELHAYKTSDAQGNLVERMSASSDPIVPRALQPAIKAIHGLYTIEDHPLHSMQLMDASSPEATSSSGSHYITPGDFTAIYGYNGGAATGETIGIVGHARTDFNDFQNFRQITKSNFPNPTEIIPTAFGGVDPGPAYTAPPAANVSLGDQSEATLDVMRAGNLGGAAPILLVVATPASGGIEAAAQYLVQTTPVPAHVMSISFGACESSAGPSAVAFWDTLLQQAAAEGISVLVSSGDSGASGCDPDFTAPPASPLPNSPNYICSSSYATCVGGTQFNDTNNPTQYWTQSNSSNLASALGYIPEGAWNEPLSSSGNPQVAASGGGVSSVIATPVWQTGTGVPAARVGRYTPDIAFSASIHDGYFACFAAAGGDCVSAANGSFHFVIFGGTSAAAPSMAGIASLLDSIQQAPQGNLNRPLYQMAANAPTVFNDVTVASSGVSNCALATPSLCNNSIPGSGGNGGQAGYTVTAGYDEVTGLGSLQILNFINNFPTPPTIKIVSNPTPTFPSQLLGFPTPGEVGFENGGTTSLDPLSVAITGTNAGDFTLVNNCQSALPARGTCTVDLIFTPSATGARTATMTVTSANASNSPLVLPLSGTGTTTPYTPNVIVSANGSTFTVAQTVTVTVLVLAPPIAPSIPTGSITLTSGSYKSDPVPLVNAKMTITFPATALAMGDDTIMGTYTPDSTSSSIFSSASGVQLVTITPVPPPSFNIGGTPLKIAPGATTGNTSSISLFPTGGFSGNVTLSATVTTAPAGAQHLPTFSFGATSPVNLAGTAGGSATLTVFTTAPTANARPAPANRISWYTTAVASLACLLFVGAPTRSRRWRSMLGMVLLLITFAAGVVACGGGSGSSGAGGSSTSATSDPGSTAGNYIVTITGTAPGAATATCTIGLTIN